MQQRPRDWLVRSSAVDDGALLQKLEIAENTIAELVERDGMRNAETAAAAAAHKAELRTMRSRLDTTELERGARHAELPLPRLARRLHEVRHAVVVLVHEVRLERHLRPPRGARRAGITACMHEPA